MEMAAGGGGKLPPRIEALLAALKSSCWPTHDRSPYTVSGGTEAENRLNTLAPPPPPRDETAKCGEHAKKEDIVHVFDRQSQNPDVTIASTEVEDPEADGPIGMFDDEDDCYDDFQSCLVVKNQEKDLRRRLFWLKASVEKLQNMYDELLTLKATIKEMSSERSLALKATDSMNRQLLQMTKGQRQIEDFVVVVKQRLAAFDAISVLKEELGPDPEQFVVTLTLATFTESSKISGQSGETNQTTRPQDILVSLLARIDKASNFFLLHNDYVDSERCLADLQTLRMDLLHAIRSVFLRSLRRVEAQAASKVRALAAENASGAPVLHFPSFYAKFRAAGRNLKFLTSVVHTQSNKEDFDAVYSQTLDVLEGEYVSTRLRLIIDPLKAQLEKVMTRPPVEEFDDGMTGLSVATRQVVTLVLSVAQLELKTFAAFFELRQPRTILDTLLTAIADLVAEHIRPRLLKAESLEELREVLESLAVDINDFGGADGISILSSLEPLASVFLQLQKDCQERLIFKAERFIAENIQNFKPSPQDVDYPDKLFAEPPTFDATVFGQTPILPTRIDLDLGDHSVGTFSPLAFLTPSGAQSTRQWGLRNPLHQREENATLDGEALRHSENTENGSAIMEEGMNNRTRTFEDSGEKLEREETSENKVLLLPTGAIALDERGPSTTVVQNGVKDPLFMEAKLASKHSSLYPPVVKLLALFSLTANVLMKNAFEMLASQAIQCCLSSLDVGAREIEKTKAPTFDASLFLIKHLLIIREEISALDCDLIESGDVFDFSGARERVLNFFLRRNNEDRSPNNEGDLKSIPNSDEAQIRSTDIKHELDMALKHECEQFTARCVALLLLPFLQLTATFSAIKRRETQEFTAIENGSILDIKSPLHKVPVPLPLLKEAIGEFKKGFLTNAPKLVFNVKAYLTSSTSAGRVIRYPPTWPAESGAETSGSTPPAVPNAAYNVVPAGFVLGNAIQISLSSALNQSKSDHRSLVYRHIEEELIQEIYDDGGQVVTFSDVPTLCQELQWWSSNKVARFFDFTDYD